MMVGSFVIQQRVQCHSLLHDTSVEKNIY